MVDHTPELLQACGRAGNHSERRYLALILADFWESQGHGGDAEAVRQAVQFGADGLAMALALPPGGSGRAAGDLKILRFKDHKTRFRWCPPGLFRMGSPPDEEERYADENQVDVRLTRGFWIAEVGVTQELWLAADGGWLNWSKYGAGPGLPVHNVSHDEALGFAESLTDRLRETSRLLPCWKLSLPTEAQWEYACRAGARTRYPWGDDERGLIDHAWTRINLNYRPHEVGTLRPNNWGIHDMLGNLRAWCLDGWSDRLPGGDDPLADPAQSPYRAVRGSSWSDLAQFHRPAYRHRNTPKYRRFDLGFRLVLVQETGDMA